MAYEIERKQSTEKVVELYSPDIRIRGNPEDEAAGSITLDLHKLHIYGGAFDRLEYIGTVGETVGAFAARQFNIGEKVITGSELAQCVKQYTEQMYRESIQPVEGSDAS